MNGFNTRVRLWDKKKKIMLPSSPLYKCDFTSVDCSKYEIMLSAGLHDKNGKEIYEGDRYRWRDEEKGIIIFKGGEFKCMSKEIYGLFSMLPELEIIGNIYENKRRVIKLKPKILKDKQ